MAALEKELERYPQAENKSESAQQETDAPSKAAYKMAVKYCGQLQTTGVFADDHPAIQMVKAGLDQARAASDESVPLSKRIRTGQNQIAMHERDLKAANDRVQERSRAFWPLSRAQNSTEPRSRTSRSRCRSGGTTWSSFTDKLQLKLRTEPRPRSWKSCSQKESPCTCSMRRRTAARAANVAMELDEFGSLNDQDDPTPDPTAEARIQASIDVLLQAQTRGDPERLAVL